MALNGHQWCQIGAIGRRYCSDTNLDHMQIHYATAYSKVIQDPFSALDTHVGESVFNNVLLDRTSGTTWILVTHALHFLLKVDYIYFMVNGCIAEHSTFDEIMANCGDFFV